MVPVALKIILSLSEAFKRPQKVSPEDDSPSLISEGTTGIAIQEEKLRLWT